MTRWFRRSAVLASAIATAAAAAPLEPSAAALRAESVKPVPALPGWDGPLPIHLWSGFVDVSDTPGQQMNMHYTVHECEDDAKRLHGAKGCPVLIWWNGGPGAPSSFGVFIESGPLLLNEQSYTTEFFRKHGQPGLVRNPHAWTKVATVLAFANPPPTGFSYCTPPGPANVSGAACGKWSDTRVGRINAVAVGTVLSRHFPALLGQELFFVGESYAGVYISATTMAISMHATAGTAPFPAIADSLAGVGLGDACMGKANICGFGDSGVYDSLFFLYGHGQFPAQQWGRIMAACRLEDLKHKDAKHLPPACRAEVRTATAMVGKFFTYNLYDNCPSNMFDAGDIAPRVEAARRSPDQRVGAILAAGVGPLADDHEAPAARLSRVGGRRAAATAAALRSPAGGAAQPTNFNGYWCPGSVFMDYMKRHDVRAALGVPLDDNFFLADDAVGMPYDINMEDPYPFWAAVLRTGIRSPLTAAAARAVFGVADGVPGAAQRLEQIRVELERNASRGLCGAAAGGLRRPVVMAYTGDADPAVNTVTTQRVWYAFAGNYTFDVAAPWRPWLADRESGVVGGGVASWCADRLRFLTVRGSGHMVPEYKPKAAFAMMRDFIASV